MEVKFHKEMGTNLKRLIPICVFIPIPALQATFQKHILSPLILEKFIYF